MEWICLFLMTQNYENLTQTLKYPIPLYTLPDVKLDISYYELYNIKQLSLKYRRFTPSGCKDIEIRKSSMASDQFNFSC